MYEQYIFFSVTNKFLAVVSNRELNEKSDLPCKISYLRIILGKSLSFAFSEGNYFKKKLPLAYYFRKLHENPHGNEKAIGHMPSF